MYSLIWVETEARFDPLNHTWPSGQNGFMDELARQLPYAQYRTRNKMNGTGTWKLKPHGQKIGGSKCWTFSIKAKNFMDLTSNWKEFWDLQDQISTLSNQFYRIGDETRGNWGGDGTIKKWGRRGRGRDGRRDEGWGGEGWRRGGRRMRRRG